MILVATIAFANNNQYPTTNTARCIELRIDNTSVPIRQLISHRHEEFASWPCSRRDVIVTIWNARLRIYAYYQYLYLTCPCVSWCGEEESEEREGSDRRDIPLITSSAPPALLPLHVCYPWRSNNQLQESIALKERSELFVSFSFYASFYPPFSSIKLIPFRAKNRHARRWKGEGECEAKRSVDLPISPKEPFWPALGIWQFDPIPAPAILRAAMTFGSSAKSDDVYISESPKRTRVIEGDIYWGMVDSKEEKKGWDVPHRIPRRMMSLKGTRL